MALKEVDKFFRPAQNWPGVFCATRMFVKTTCSILQPELEVWKRKEDHTRSVSKIAQSRARTHHSEQQDMSTLLLTPICVLEFVSQEDGGHQWRDSLVVLTLPGAGRAGVLRELKTRRANRKGGEAGRSGAGGTLRRSGTSCTRSWKAKKTRGQAWANRMLEKMQAKNAVPGKTKKDDKCQSVMCSRRESCAADEMEPVFQVQCAPGCRRNIDVPGRCSF